MLAEEYDGAASRVPPIQLGGVHEGYWVTTDGRVWSDVSQSWLGGYVGANGYHYYTFKDGKRAYAHRLVAHCYLHLDLDDTTKQVNHLDYDRRHNCYTNLEVVTPSGNQVHAYLKTDRSKVNSYNHPNSKLTKEQAVCIFNSNGSERALASEYGVSSRTIHDIKHGVKYGWATKEDTRT